ncbi:MAG TPA: caspase family protein [Pyrinomonadaceae bacterium]|jgi:hypothetical protein
MSHCFPNFFSNAASRVLPRIFIFAIFASTLLVSTAAQARKLARPITYESEKRFALVIGNGSYGDQRLNNPVNDANDMAATLKRLGFEVSLHTDVNRDSMRRAVKSFGEQLRKTGGVGLFYFAGHGVQVKGVNYLIPIGASVNGEAEIEDEGVDAGMVLRQMEDANNKMNIVILDACRNNPFARSLRSADKGLASIDAPSGTLIAYATAPGSVASDGTGKNGLYTQELLKQIQAPNLKIEDVFKRVRAGVQQQTRGQQVPWESSSLVNDFYFVTSGKPQIPPVPIIENQPTSGNVSMQPKKADGFVKKEAFFTFELNKCVKSGTAVSCSLTITNNDSMDKLLGFEWLENARIYDEQGSEGKMEGWQIAGKSMDKANLLPDVPVKANLRFKNVSSQATVLKRIDLALTANFREGGNYVTKDFRVRFEDVPLQ